MNLYKFYWDCGRMGDLEGLFVVDSKDLENLYGKEIYFGEVLGKHSEIYGTLESKDISLISDDQEKIDWLVNLFGTSISGFNPVDYYEPDDEYESENEDD